MNRRTFLKTPALIPLFGADSDNEVRATLLIDDSTPVNVIVQSHLTQGAAERYRQDWIGRVWEDPLGEWYVLHSEYRALPAHLAELPGSLSYHETQYGEAGDFHVYLTGAFRRDHISCIVRVRDDDEPLMADITAHIASRPIPSLFEVTWNPIRLQAFIPNEHSLGVSVTPDSWHFP